MIKVLAVPPGPASIVCAGPAAGPHVAPAARPPARVPAAGARGLGRRP
jgi:hypothetical protein